MKTRTLVIGDIHGAYRALMQCFERSAFDIDNDRLIVLGDVCDGYPEVKQCIDALLTVKHCDYIIGNHDLWALDWAIKGEQPQIWTSQGGKQTIASYGGGPMLQEHIEFLKHAHPWIVYKNKLFVHGGIDPEKKIEEQDVEDLTWDRELVERAWERAQRDPGYKFSVYEEIFVGHTTTQWFARKEILERWTAEEPVESRSEPLFLCNVIALDTGAGWSGKLTIMDADTHKYWQSDPTPDLYGNQGRR